MHYLDNTLGNPPAMHYGNHVEDAQYEHRTKGSNIRTRTINGMLFVWLLSAIGLAVVMNVMLMQIMRLSLSSGEWSAATTTTTTTTVMNVSYRRMSTSETLDTSPEWRHVDVDKPYGRYRIWMPSSLTRQPTTAPAIVIADVHKGDFYIERLANNKKNDSAYTVPFVLQPPAEHDISINNNTVIDSFIVRIESSKSITGASVRLISPGVYHVNYTLGRWMDIVRHRLTVRVEYVDYPLDALTMANEVRDRRQLKVPRFKKV